MRRHPNPLAVARLMRGPVELAPDPVEPDPLLPGLLEEPPRQTPHVEPTTHATRPRVPAPPALCGHCTHGYEGHGRQYGAIAGWHEWAAERLTRSAPSTPWLHRGEEL